MKQKNKIILGIIILLQLIILSYFISLNGALIWDEAVYLANAKDKITHSYFTEDFRFPLLSTIIAGVWKITGESILAAQITMMLITILTTIIFYQVAKHFLEPKFALLATFLLAFSSQYIHWGFRIYTDILGMLLILTTLLILLNNKYKKTTKNKKNKYINQIKKIFNNNLILIAGIFTGLAFVARLSTIIIATPIAIYFLINKNWLKNITKYATGFIIALTPWMIEGIIKTRNPLNFALAQTSAILEYTAREPPSNFLNFLINDFGIALLIIWGSILYFIQKPTNKKIFTINKTNKKILLLIMIIITQLIFYMYFVKLKLARYIIELTPFIILLIIIGIQAITTLTQKKHKIMMLTFLIALTIMGILMPSYETIQNTKTELKCTSTGALHESIQIIKEKTVPGQTIVSSVWPYYGYYANLKAYSPWSEDIEDYFKSYDPDYFILSKNIGIPYTQEIKHPKITKIKTLTDECGWDLTIYEVK